MGWSIRIARVAGTEVKIHLTFLLLLAWIWYMHYRIGGTAEAWEGVIFVLLLFGCVLLHEFGHVLAARRYGIPTPDITLLPIGGVARLQRMPDKPSEELVVAIAGPIVNVVIAAVLFLILGRVTDMTPAARLEDPRVDMLARVAWANVIIVAFNLIPAFPMDGGRVLRAVLAMGLPYARATQIAATIGQGLAFVFAVVGLFGLGGVMQPNPLLIFVAIFIYMGASAEASQAQIRDLAHNTGVSEAMMTRFVTLPADARIDSAVEALLRTAQHEFPVVDAADRLTGVLTRNGLIKALRETGPETPVTLAMHPNVPTVRNSASFNEAFRLMQECGCPGVGVVDAAGRLVGLLTPENVGEMMMVRAALNRSGTLPPRVPREDEVNLER